MAISTVGVSSGSKGAVPPAPPPVVNRRTVGVVLAGLILLAMVWILPMLGLPLALAALVLLAPVGDMLQDRLTVLAVLLLGAAAAAFSVAQLPVTLFTVQILGSLGVLALGAGVILMPAKVAIPTEPATWVIVVIGVVLMGVMAWPLAGYSPAQVLSYLAIGWDHSSHFAIFLGSFEQGATHFVTDDGDFAFGVSYPSVLTWLWAAMVPLVPWAGTAPAELVPVYAVFSAATTTLGLMMLCALTADMARQVTTLRRGGPAAGALVSGVLFIVGTATLFQDHGHVNFMMAVVVGLTGGWYSVRFVMAGRPILSWAVLLAGAIFTGLTYPPVAALLAAPAIVVLIQSTKGRGWLRLLATVVVGAFALAIVARWGIGPETVSSILDSLVLQTGGLQPFDVMLVMVTPLTALLLMRHAAVARGWPMAVALGGGFAGLAAVALLLTWRVLATGGSVAGSYYTVKMWLGCWLVAEVLLAVLVALWFSEYLARQRQSGGVLAGAWSGVAWLALVGVVGASAGYLGPNSELLPAGSPVAPGLSARKARVDLLNVGQEGQLILSADDVLNTQGAQPILWDGGETKNNHYLMAFNGKVGSGERSLLSSLPVPFGQPAADILSAYLAQHPERSVQIAYFRDESAPVLRALRLQHPDQVEIRRMG